mmetsp:Transcript_19536/g.21851  ORF Transcript_19536/g.21851 Transcript_19536/m.21851 type:complete len:122 (-) Transcript_19536:854-1219(-)
MFSSLVSRIFVFSFESLTEDELQQVNNFWLNVHPIYCDREAGKYVNFFKKEHLKIDDNPFFVNLCMDLVHLVTVIGCMNTLLFNLKIVSMLYNVCTRTNMIIKSMSTIAVVMIDRKKMLLR